jgi:hypothetical protein
MLSAIDRHRLASIATLVLKRCSWWPESAQMPKILGLHTLEPAATVEMWAACHQPGAG